MPFDGMQHIRTFPKRNTLPLSFWSCHFATNTIFCKLLNKAQPQEIVPPCILMPNGHTYPIPILPLTPLLLHIGCKKIYTPENGFPLCRPIVQRPCITISLIYANIVYANAIGIDVTLLEKQALTRPSPQVLYSIFPLFRHMLDRNTNIHNCFILKQEKRYIFRCTTSIDVPVHYALSNHSVQ